MFSTSDCWSTESTKSIESDVLYVFFRNMWPWKPHETDENRGKDSMVSG